MKVLHLLSWFPTPANPLNGNFCLKHIAAVSDKVESVALSVMLDNEIDCRRKVEVIDYQNFKHIYIHLRPSEGLMERWRTKLRQFCAYNFGLKYVKRHFFTPDLVHQHVTLPVGRVAYFWKKVHRIPYIITEHWSIFTPENSGSVGWGTRRLICAIANNAECILPVSADLQRNMERFGISRPFTVVPNVVDTALFTPRENCGKARKRILHISNLREDAKNVTGMLRVIRRLTAVRRDFVLDIIHDECKPELEQYVRDQQLEDIVVFHGQKSEEVVAQFLSQSDFYLSFSNFETFGCVLIEAMACGKPVVTTPVGIATEINMEKLGVSVGIGDEDALFEAVGFMLDHHQEFDAAAIRDYAVANFSKEVVGERLYGVYGEVTGLAQ